MFDHIRTVLKLRPSEGRITSLMFLYVLGILTFHYILKPLRARFFLQAFPASDLPYAYILTALFAGLVATLVFRLGQRVSLVSLITITNGGIVGTLFVFRAVIDGELVFLPYAYYVYVQTVSGVAMAQFWLLAARVYDSRQAKRTYSLLGAGAITGAVVGSVIPGFLSDRLSVESMFTVCIGIMIALTGLAHTVWRSRRKVAISVARQRERDTELDRFRGLCRMVSTSGHLRLIGLLILLTVIGSQLAEWQLSQAVQSFYGNLGRIEQGTRINEFFGRFYLVTNVVGMLLQVVVTGFLVRRFGILAASLFLPVALLAGGLGVLIAPGLAAATFTRGSDAAFRYSTSRTSLELLYLPLSPVVRERLKVFVDVFVDRVGRAVAGILILLLTSSVLPFGLRGTAFVMVVVTVASIFVAVRVRRTYVEEFRHQLERSEVDLSEMANSVTDPASVQMLVDTLGSSEQRRVAYALKLLQSSKGVDFHVELIPLLKHPSSRIRMEAVRTLPALSQDFESEAKRLLLDEDDGVREAALDYLLRYSSPDSAGTLEAMLHHEDAAIQTLAAFWAFEHAPMEFRAPREVVDGLLAMDGIRSRSAGIRLASRLETSEANRILERLLMESDGELTGVAAGAAARIGAIPLVTRIIELLAEARSRKHAKQALVRYGRAIAPQLGEVLSNETGNLLIRRELPWVLARIGGSEAAEALLRNLGVEDRMLRYRVVKGLNHLHRFEPNLPSPSSLIAAQIFRETQNYYEALLLSRTLGEKTSLLGRAIDERLDRDMELIFCLIGLQYPQKDIYFAYSAIRGDHVGRRTAALEFIDNVLKADLKSIILPLLEDEPTDHIIDQAARRYAIRIGDIQDALNRVLEQSDSWLTACALYEIGVRNIDEMIESCRRLTRHNDSIVRESAYWALGRLEVKAEGLG